MVALVNESHVSADHMVFVLMRDWGRVLIFGNLCLFISFLAHSRTHTPTYTCFRVLWTLVQQNLCNSFRL